MTIAAEPARPVVESAGLDAAASTAAVAPAVPALVVGRVKHARFHPIRHAFEYRAHQWLVDVDRPHASVPRALRRLVSFEARDHVGSADGTLGANVRAFLAEQGVTWSADRIVMLANARTLGYVFDPLSVYWCYAADGTFEGVLAEVHNTYGERHAYVLELDEHGGAQTEKKIYVSPFFGVFGEYTLRFVLRGDKVAAFVTLRQDGRVVFTGSFVGYPRPVTTARILRSAVTQPLMPLRVAALIRLHGAWLWLRRQPVVRRIPHDEQRGAR